MADVPGCYVTVGQPLPSTHLVDMCPVPDLAVLRPLGAEVGWVRVPFRAPAVDLVVEVVAPSSRAEDLGPKRDLYRRLGVGACWTVDQRTGQVMVHWSDRPAMVPGVSHGSGDQRSGRP